MWLNLSHIPIRALAVPQILTQASSFFQTSPFCVTSAQLLRSASNILLSYFRYVWLYAIYAQLLITFQQEHLGCVHFAMDAWTSNHHVFVAWTVHLEYEGKMLAFLLDIAELPEVIHSYQYPKL